MTTNVTRLKCSEHQMQRALIEWARLHPDIGLLMFAIPNGMKAPSKAHAAKMKREGLTAGVPDLFLAVARGEYHGLFIELKTKDGRVSKTQKEQMERFGEQGYCISIPRSVDEAIQEVTAYLALPPPEQKDKPRIITF